MSSARTAPTAILVLADIVPGSRVRDVALVAAGAGLTGMAAQVSITTPLSPVPFTLQTLAVLVTGAALGSVRGLLSMVLYLAVGALGFPWFSNGGSGWGGPTFGYVVGFAVAALAVGALAERRADRHVVSTVVMMALGNVIIYLIGATWLAHDLGLSASKAFELGVRPFLGTDALKIGLAALALPGAWKLAGR
jgi:biotin transport system substrate-specific component